MPEAERRVALVTGSSRGLGSAIARRLAGDGLAVAVNGLHEDELLVEVVESIRTSGGTAAAFAADVTDAHQVDDLVTAIAARFGTVDVLVLNATGPRPTGRPTPRPRAPRSAWRGPGRTSSPPSASP